MYYKVTDNRSEVYIRLLDLRIKEKSIDQANENAISEKVGIPFTEYLGDPGQGFSRTIQMIGFAFENVPQTDDFEITWKEDKEFKGFYVPNTRTKKGKEMKKFLDGLESVFYIELLSALSINDKWGKFNVPQMFFKESGVCLIRLDEKHTPTSPSVEEITSKEWNELYKENPASLIDLLLFKSKLNKVKKGGAQ